MEHISAEYGIPIINKRISVTPIAMLLGACPDADPVDFAKTLDAAGKKVGVNFVGGYTALVHKGFSAGDLDAVCAAAGNALEECSGAKDNEAIKAALRENGAVTALMTGSGAAVL